MQQVCVCVQCYPPCDRVFPGAGVKVPFQVAARRWGQGGRGEERAYVMEVKVPCVRYVLLCCVLTARVAPVSSHFQHELD